MSKQHFLISLTACALFVFIFNPTHLYFLSDDWDSLLFSLQPSNIFHSFRPLSDTILLLDYSIWKMNAGGFHFTNYLLHFGCVFCVYHLAKKFLLLRYENEIASSLSLACSLFFLYYPFHSEAVFWIVGRGAILCTLFGLLSFLFFIEKEKNRFCFLLSVLCFVLALLSYEQAWIIPLVITILTLIYNHQSKASKGFQVSLYWIVFLVYLAGRFYFTQSVIGTPYGTERMMNFDVLFLLRSFGAFVFRSFIPPFQSALVFGSFCAIVGGILIVLLFLYRRKIQLGLLLSTSFFLISLIPVLPLSINTHNTESERYLYFPSVFFTLLIVQLFAIASEKRYKVVYVLLTAGVISLWLSYNSFEVSSSVSEKTAELIGDLSNADTLFCQELPGQYKGAFIFRNGFKSMVKMEKNESIKSVEILSALDMFQPAKYFAAEFNHSSKTDSSNNASINWTEQKVTLKK